MPSRAKPGELPKPVLQSDQLGCLPVNPLTVSYLARGHAELLIGLRDTEETQALKRKPVIHVASNETPDDGTLSLEGRIFNGYSDALYRGRLPETILAAPATALWAECLKDFMEYLEKLLALGFFMPRKQLAKRDPVSELIPCIIMSGDGLLFSRFISQLTRKMGSLAYEHPELDETVRIQILGRFMRGLPSGEAGQISPTAGNTGEMTPGIFPIAEVATSIRVAGGNPETRKTVQRTLSAYGLNAEVENGVRNSVERLEFENALWRITHVVFPTLLAHRRLSPEEVRTLAGRVEESILTIGKKRKAFRESEPASPLRGSLPIVPANPPSPVAQEDTAILNGLSHYADALGLPEEKALFEMISDNLSGHTHSRG